MFFQLLKFYSSNNKSELSFKAECHFHIDNEFAILNIKNKIEKRLFNCDNDFLEMNYKVIALFVFLNIYQTFRKFLLVF